MQRLALDVVRRIQADQVFHLSRCLLMDAIGDKQREGRGEGVAGVLIFNSYQGTLFVLNALQEFARCWCSVCGCGTGGCWPDSGDGARRWSGVRPAGTCYAGSPHCTSKLRALADLPHLRSYG